jgi:hypothetical protein
LPQDGIHQRRLPVVNVGNNGNVAKFISAFLVWHNGAPSKAKY